MGDDIKSGVSRDARSRAKEYSEFLRSPFPYFGGKSKIAGTVWRLLGDVAHYIEPCFGSGAVLLNRPTWHARKAETVNDADGFVCNVWRALQAAPDEVAQLCDWPVNQADLSARRRDLVARGNQLYEKLSTDSKWYDTTMAGYWIWSAACWIGRGLTKPTSFGQRPHISRVGQTIHMPGPRSDDPSVDVVAPYNTSVYSWFRVLSDRLRYVRVVCGDWTKVCGGSWQTIVGECGIFFDPPYAHDTGDGRDGALYAVESATIAKDIAEWSIERGRSNRYRIVIAGYDDEHPELIERGWKVHRWWSQGGYGGVAADDEARGTKNRYREALFCSPHCFSVT